MYHPKGNETFSEAVSLAGGANLPMVVKAAIELGIFEMMAAEGANNNGGLLTAEEIVSRLPTKNPEALSMIERMLRYLASYSVLTYSVVGDGSENHSRRAYGLTQLCKHFIPNQHGFSLAPALLFVHHIAALASWNCLKDAILDGGIPFNKANGMTMFEYAGKDARFNEIFNLTMRNTTDLTNTKLLQAYKGFEGLTEILDVGGGIGVSIAAIVSKYPQIKGINFDLPHVIKDAPIHQGVVHVEGDMFEEVPKAEAIYMKFILHDWSDDNCVKLLRNCWKALAPSGKVIVVESLLPENPESDLLSRQMFFMDVRMMTLTPGGKERTKTEFEALAKETGFSLEVVCQVPNDKVWVIEFHKVV